MPKIEITHNHKDTAADAKAKLDTLNKELADKYGLSSRWLSDTEAKVERTGASGTIKIEATKVLVSLDLSFVLGSIKGKVEDKIKQELTRLFG